MAENPRPYLRYGEDAPDQESHAHYNAALNNIDKQDRDQKIAEKKQKSSTLLIIAAAVINVIIIIAGILIYYFFLRSSSSSGSGANSNIPLYGGCGTGKACAPGLVCSNSKCQVAPQGQCGLDEQCPQNYVCNSFTNTCLGTTGGVCSVDMDCNSPLGCISGTCQQVPCSTPGVNIPCTNGGMCSNGQFCGGLETQFCNVDTDCARPYFCNDGVCASQPCPSGDLSKCTNIGFLQGGCHNNGTAYYCSNNVNQPCVQNDQCVDYKIGTLQQYLICDTADTNVCKMQGNSYCNGTDPTSCIGDGCCQSNKCALNSDTQCSCVTAADCPGTNPVCQPALGLCF